MKVGCFRIHLLISWEDKMDFLKDLEDILLKKCEKIGIEIIYTDIHDFLRKYYNIQLKIIDIKPYEVFYSEELKIKMDKSDYLKDLKLIEEKFKNGHDINPHLGKKSFDLDFQDGLINDWGINHLHLNSEKDTKDHYYILRSDWLLLFIIDYKCVYFIDVRSHKESRDSSIQGYPLWFREDLLKVIKNNWEFLLEKHELNGFKLQEKTSKEEYLLRDHGITSFITIEDNVYAPLGGGVTAGGEEKQKIGTNQVYFAIKLINEICGHYRYIKKNPKEIKEFMIKKGFKIQSEVDFKLIDDSKYGLIIVEKNTGFKISIYNPYIKKI